MKLHHLSLTLLLSCALINGTQPVQNKEKQITITKTASTKGQPMNSIITTASGLRYEVLTAPQPGAKSPTKGQKATVHYTGWLNDNDKPGKKFDSSVDRNQAFAFNVGAGYVIAGWDEGVMGMKVGEKRRFYIPSKLGYGSRGAGAIIPANADLIFDVELLEIA